MSNVVKMKMRAAVLGQKLRRTRVEFEINGEKFEADVLAPTIGIREHFLELSKQGHDHQEAYLCVACTVMPRTPEEVEKGVPEELVFEPADAEIIRTKLEANANDPHRRLSLEAMRFMRTGVETEAKKSIETGNTDSSTKSLPVSESSSPK